jgi:hypothetical protein
MVICYKLPTDTTKDDRQTNRFRSLKYTTPTENISDIQQVA